MNDKIEAELVEFKDEIEKNFSKSDINRTYVFKRLPPDEAAMNSRLVTSINRIMPKEKRRASASLGLGSEDQNSNTGPNGVSAFHNKGR